MLAYLIKRLVGAYEKGFTRTVDLRWTCVYPFWPSAPEHRDWVHQVWLLATDKMSLPKCHHLNASAGFAVPALTLLAPPSRRLQREGAQFGETLQKQSTPPEEGRRGRRDVIGRNTRSVNEEFTFIRNFRPYCRPNKLPLCAFCANSE